MDQDKTTTHKAARLIISKAKLPRGSRLEPVTTYLPDTKYFWANEKRCGSCLTDGTCSWVKGQAPGNDAIVFRYLENKHGQKG